MRRPCASDRAGVHTVGVSAPEQFRPPVYGCAAGAVLHVHAGSTLEPAVVLHTFLPPSAASALDGEGARVDVHSDGPGSDTLTLRVLVSGTALSWQLPITPFVAALPGQSGDEGRMVLLALVDAEPDAAAATRPVDCEQLAAELQLPVADLAEALRGRLTTWLADDLELLLHDDAHDRAVDRSPAQTLATAVLSSYRAELDAEAATTRVVRALELAPEPYTAELARRLCSAVATAFAVSPATTVTSVREATGPFEDEVLRQLDGVPAALEAAAPAARTQAAMDVLLAGDDRDEAVRAAVSVVARLARSGFGPDLPDAEVLRRLAMVDDAGLARLAALWVQLADGASREPAGDTLVAREVAERAMAEGAPGLAWLGATAAALLDAASRTAGRGSPKLVAPLQATRALLALDAGGADQLVTSEVLPGAITGMLALARHVRSRGRVGPGEWVQLPAPLVAGVVLEQWADGLADERVVDLLDTLLAEDVEPVDLLDALVCSTAQLLVEVDPPEDAGLLERDVARALAATPGGPRGARWLMQACLREAHEHDPGAVALADYLPSDSVDADRAAERLGTAGLLGAGLQVVRGLADSFGETGQLPRPVSLAMFLSTALAEHELLRGLGSGTSGNG